MSSGTLKDQWMVIAVGINGELATLSCSDEIKARIESCSHPGDNFNDGELPKAPGIYRWSGDYWYESGGWCGSEPIDPDERFIGTFAPVDTAPLEAAAREALEALESLELMAAAMDMPDMVSISHTASEKLNSAIH